MRQRGLSLIELVIVIVALTAGTALIGTAFYSSASSVADNEDIQIAWQVVQACMDHTLGRVRKPGDFTNVATGSNPCSTLPTNGATRSVSVTTYSAGTEPCQGGSWSCRLLSVSVTRGGYTASASYVFIDY